MNEETIPQNPADEAGSAGTAEQASRQAATDAEVKATTDELVEELKVLGNRFVEVMQAAWNSDERKRIEADLKQGLNTVAGSLEESFQKVGESRQTQEAINKADRVAEDVGNKLRGNDAVQDITRGLTKGLQSLASTLERWTQEMQERDSSVDGASTADDDGEEIPIDRA